MAWCGRCRIFRERLKGYDEEITELERYEVQLRQFFVAEQQDFPTAPEMRTMTGLQYRKKAEEAEHRINLLRKKVQFTKLLIAEHKGRPNECPNAGWGLGGADQGSNNTQSTWHSVDEKEFRFWQKGGKMTRTVGEGKNRRFEVME